MPLDAPARFLQVNSSPIDVFLFLAADFFSGLVLSHLDTDAWMLVKRRACVAVGIILQSESESLKPGVKVVGRVAVGSDVDYYGPRMLGGLGVFVPPGGGGVRGAEVSCDGNIMCHVRQAGAAPYLSTEMCFLASAPTNLATCPT